MIIDLGLGLTPSWYNDDILSQSVIKHGNSPWDPPLTALSNTVPIGKGHGKPVIASVLYMIRPRHSSYIIPSPSYIDNSGRDPAPTIRLIGIVLRFPPHGAHAHTCSLTHCRAATDSSTHTHDGVTHTHTHFLQRRYFSSSTLRLYL